MVGDNNREIDTINDVSESRREKMVRLMKYMDTSNSNMVYNNNKKVNDLKEQYKSQSDMNTDTRVKVTKLIKHTGNSRGIADNTRKRLSILEETMFKTTISKDGLSGSFQQVNPPPQEK